MSGDRFELETDILNLHGVADDLDVLATAILEHDATTDDTVNAVLGLSTLLRMKITKTFDTFKAAFKLDEYSPERQAYTQQN